MHMSITESGNYQTIRKATVKPLFSGVFCKKYFIFVIIFERKFFHFTKPRNLSGIAYRFKNHCRYYSKFPLFCQWVAGRGLKIFGTCQKHAKPSIVFIFGLQKRRKQNKKMRFSLAVIFCSFEPFYQKTPAKIQKSQPPHGCPVCYPCI